MIYDYLFYKSYQLAQKSKNFEDAPVLGGIWGVIPCLMLNIFTIILFIDTMFNDSIGNSKIFTTGKYIFSGLFILSLLFYYRSGSRWKRIVAKYETREKGKGIHPIIVLVIAYSISVILINIAAMYKHKYFIFS